ncbi:hypothetical protein BGZ72_010676 [Mortierella alpina]|nr:hypothetical protein BGZ72_010676 [Mortierella alpina]
MSPDKTSFQISYLDQSTRSKVTVVVSPQLLLQPVDTQRTTHARFQDYTISPAPENIVFRFAKAQAKEWHAMQLTFKSVAVQMASAEAETEAEAEIKAEGSINTNGMDVDQEGRPTLEESESVILKFVTEANVGEFHGTIRGISLWQSEHEQHVGNVQAKRVPGMNAIHMTAELVSNVSSSS